MASNESHSVKNGDDGPERKNWQPMMLSYLGEARNIVLGGPGKVTRATGDPGEPRKVPGQEGP